MKEFYAIAALAAVLALPSAMATTVGTDMLTGPAAGVVPFDTSSFPVFYVSDDGSVWEENNGHAGLQTSDMHDQQGNKVAGPDLLLFSAAMLPVPDAGAVPLPDVGAFPVPALPGL